MKASLEQNFFDYFIEKMSQKIIENINNQKQSIINEIIEGCSSSYKKHLDYSKQTSIGETFITSTEIAAKLKISKVTLWRLRKNEKFPKPRPVFSNKVVWLNKEIEDWMQSYRSGDFSLL